MKLGDGVEQCNALRLLLSGLSADGVLPVAALAGNSTAYRRAIS